MRYTIEKYKAYKSSRGRVFIKAKIIKRNLFGSITKIYWETLDQKLNCLHQSKDFYRSEMFPLKTKTEANSIIDILNKKL